MGHPNLRRIAAPVADAHIDSPDMERLLEDMVDTLKDSGGIGLAAPQINEDLRLAIIEIPGGPTRYGDIAAMPLTVFFNPSYRSHRYAMRRLLGGLLISARATRLRRTATAHPGNLYQRCQTN
jgi:peptide deformylase